MRKLKEGGWYLSRSREEETKSIQPYNTSLRYSSAGMKNEESPVEYKNKILEEFKINSPFPIIIKDIIHGSGLSMNSMKLVILIHFI